MDERMLQPYPRHSSPHASPSGHSAAKMTRPVCQVAYENEGKGLPRASERGDGKGRVTRNTALPEPGPLNSWCPPHPTLETGP
jgi:hypothetical protein